MSLTGFAIERIDTSLDDKQTDKLKRAYLELFNTKENLKYLSFTQIPFSEKLVSDWFKHSKDDGIEYYAVFNKEHDIIAISVIKKNSVEGVEILGTVVSKNYRRQGLGGLLTEHVTGIAEAGGFKAIDVSVFTDNKPMLLLLIELDFVPANLRYHRRSDGCDLLQLRKYL